MDNMILTVIGGGSVNWMRGLMKDVYLLDEINGGEIRLVDPNTEHAKAVAGMLNEFNELRGKHYKISVIKDRQEALKGADFVMTTFSPGSMDAFWNDLELPIKYGIRMPVSMTVGIPGISAALRAVPVAYEIVSEMEKICPGAYLLNVTNPMSAVTRALNMVSNKTKVIGMCHEFHALGSYIGPMLGLYKPKDISITDYLYKWLPEQGLEYTVAGVNHFIWITEAKLNGVDVIPDILEYSRKNTSFASEKTGIKSANAWQNGGEAKLALCRQFGYLPLAGDRHLIEFYPSLCNLRNGFGMKYNVIKTTVDERRNTIKENLEYIKKIASGKQDVNWDKSGEEMTEVMRAVITGKPTRAILNLPNKGQISNMPRDVIVETLATVSKDSIQPKPSGELPGAIGSLCRLHSDIHELTVKAALEGDRIKLIEAMSLDPSGGGADFGELPDLAEELLSANRQWLPRFYD